MKELDKEIQWETVEFLIHEAREGLEEFAAMLEASRTGVIPSGWRKVFRNGPSFTEADFRAALSKAYHNLNFAWNARYCRPKEMDKDFERKGRFPRIFWNEMNRWKKHEK